MQNMADILKICCLYTMIDAIIIIGGHYIGRLILHTGKPNAYFWKNIVFIVSMIAFILVSVATFIILRSLIIPT